MKKRKKNEDQHENQLKDQNEILLFLFDIIPFLLDFLSLLAVRNDTENGTN